MVRRSSSVLRFAHSVLALACALIVALSAGLAAAAPSSPGSTDSLSEPARLYLPLVVKHRLTSPVTLGWRSYTLGRQRLDSILFAPGSSAAQTLFLGGEGALLRTSDGGHEWVRVDASRGPTLETGNWQIRTYALSPDPAEAGILYAGGLMVVRSDDFGNTWQEQPGVMRNVTRIVYSPDYRLDQTLIVVGETGAAISRDGGRTWLQSAPPGSVASLYRVRFSPHYAADGVIWASNWFGALFKSPDRGMSWMPVALPAWEASAPTPTELEDFAVTATGPATSSFYLLAREPDSMYPRYRVYRSDDGAATWNRISDLDEHARMLRADPTDQTGKTLYLGSPYDLVPVRRTVDGGLTWEDYSQGFASTWITELAVQPTAGTVYALTVGGSDPRQLLKRAPGDAGWYVVANASPDLSAFQPSVATRGDGATELVARSHRSLDGGRTWLPLNNLPDGEQVLYAIEPSPTYPHDGFAFALADQHLLRTTDGGASWHSLRACRTANYPRGSRAIAFSPAFATDRTAFVICGLELLRTKDAGAGWQKLAVNKPSTVAVSPDFAVDRHVYAVGQPSYPTRFFLSLDGGDSWDSRDFWETGALLRISPFYATDKTLFLGNNGSTGGGLWQSTDYGASWTKIWVPVEGVVDGIVLSPHDATAGSIVYAADFDWNGFVWVAYGGKLLRNLTEGLPYPLPNGRMSYRYDPDSDRLYAFSELGLWWLPMGWKTGSW